MELFRAGELDVLVATTVIEVGVDVPNATVMVILDADRFGIAQLHQLRGRVGRGAHESPCWLVDRPSRRTASPRVEALVGSTDGFELAEVDLELRGEGTMMSTAQKGRSDLRLASLRRDARAGPARPRDRLRDRRRRPDLDATRLRDELALLFTEDDDRVPHQELTARHPSGLGVHRDREFASAARDVNTPVPSSTRWSGADRRRRRRGRCPSGPGSPRSGRRRCRPAATAPGVLGVDRGSVSRWARPRSRCR